MFWMLHITGIFGECAKLKYHYGQCGGEADVQKDKLGHHLSAKRVSPSSRHIQTQQLTGTREEAAMQLLYR